MDIFKKEDFEKLSLTKSKNCISIYIPTHQSGLEVNEGIDRIAFKSEVQKVQAELEERELQNRTVSEILKPAYLLIEDLSFWKDQGQGLAVFINDKEFYSYRLPISVAPFSTISPMFDLTPLLPMLSGEDKYYILSLSQNKIRLFRNTAFTYEEINITESIPQNAQEVFAVYEFEMEDKEKKAVKEGIKRTPGAGPLASHGSNPEDSQYLYITEFLRNVNNGIAEQLKEEKAPMIVAAVENLFALYKKVNTYRYLLDDFIPGNPDYISERELHEKALTKTKDHINKTRKKDIEKYSAWGGSGKTSYNLEVILTAAFDGRVESLFILEDKHIWGQYNETERKVTVHPEKGSDDVCLLSLAAAKTIDNSGNAYLVTEQEMPEKTPTDIAAVFRY